MKKKHIFLVLAAVLVLTATIGGTMAWLTDKTEAVENVFTVGNINITLEEAEDLDLKMVPGSTIGKDPMVTVTRGSEACYLFVKIEKSSSLDNFISYTVRTGETEWIALDGQLGVYYREVAASENDQKFYVLVDNKVTVNNTVTKEMMDGLDDENAVQPELTFTAYAVQQANLTVTDAWDEANPTTTEE